MTSFRTQNSGGLLVGMCAVAGTYWLLPEADRMALCAVGLGGYIGVHLPNIQQPSTPSYHIIRTLSVWLALLVPAVLYAYRPTDLLLAWLANYLLYHGAWWLIDRISLHRDYTRGLLAIMLLPLPVAAIAYTVLDSDGVFAVFLATSLGYVTQLLLEQRSQVTVGTEAISD